MPLCVVVTLQLSRQHKGKNYRGRVAGTRGPILNPKGKNEIKFTQGSRASTNNEVEVWVVYQGLNLLKEKGVSQITVIGDSTIIIISVMHQCHKRSINILCIIQKNLGLCECFVKVPYFQVLQRKNKVSNQQANKDVSRISIDKWVAPSFASFP